MPAGVRTAKGVLASHEDNCRIQYSRQDKNTFLLHFHFFSPFIVV